MGVVRDPNHLMIDTGQFAEEGDAAIGVARVLGRAIGDGSLRFPGHVVLQHLSFLRHLTSRLPHISPGGTLDFARDAPLGRIAYRCAGTWVPCASSAAEKAPSGESYLALDLSAASSSQDTDDTLLRVEVTRSSTKCLLRNWNRGCGWAKPYTARTARCS